MRRTSRAFTLIELLVVITIISMLASLLLPALTRAKYQAGNVACVRTLRQLGGALEMYAMTTDAYLPAVVPLQGQIGQPGSTWYSWNMLLTKAIFPTKKVAPWRGQETTQSPDRSFLCPLLIRSIENGSDSGKPAWESAYRYNTSGVGPLFANPLGLGGYLVGPNFAPTRESSIAAPSEMTALGDPLTRSPDSARDGSYDPMPLQFRPQPALAGMTVIDPRFATNFRKHRNRYNRFFCDGHVEFEDVNKPFRDSDSYLARWNVDHQPHREVWRW